MKRILLTSCLVGATALLSGCQIGKFKIPAPQLPKMAFWKKDNAPVADHPSMALAPPSQLASPDTPDGTGSATALATENRHSDVNRPAREPYSVDVADTRSGSPANEMDGMSTDQQRTADFPEIKDEPDNSALASNDFSPNAFGSSSTATTEFQPPATAGRSSEPASNASPAGGGQFGGGDFVASEFNDASSTSSADRQPLRTWGADIASSMTNEANRVKNEVKDSLANAATNVRNHAQNTIDKTVDNTQKAADAIIDSTNALLTPRSNTVSLTPRSDSSDRSTSVSTDGRYPSTGFAPIERPESPPMAKPTFSDSTAIAQADSSSPSPRSGGPEVMPSHLNLNSESTRTHGDSNVRTASLPKELLGGEAGYAPGSVKRTPTTSPEPEQFAPTSNVEPIPTPTGGGDFGG